MGFLRSCGSSGIIDCDGCCPCWLLTFVFLDFFFCIKMWFKHFHREPKYIPTQNYPQGGGEKPWSSHPTISFIFYESSPEIRTCPALKWYVLFQKPVVEMKANPAFLIHLPVCSSVMHSCKALWGGNLLCSLCSSPFLGCHPCLSVVSACKG